MSRHTIYLACILSKFIPAYLTIVRSCTGNALSDIFHLDAAISGMRPVIYVKRAFVYNPSYIAEDPIVN